MGVGLEDVGQPAGLLDHGVGPLGVHQVDRHAERTLDADDADLDPARREGLVVELLGQVGLAQREALLVRFSP